jgi:hypothetical protein
LKEHPDPSCLIDPGAQIKTFSFPGSYQTHVETIFLQRLANFMDPLVSNEIGYD